MIRFQPDLGEIQPPGPHQKVFSCTNFFPTNRGGMARSFGATATAYTAACNGIVTGSALLEKSDGTARLFAGSNLRIEEADGAGSWTNRSSATYSTSVAWSFSQFGDHTIATNGVNNVQVSSTGAFADLGGSPPKAKISVVQNNIVLLFNINDGTSRPDWWASSDQNDHTTWTATSTNFADKDRLYGGVGGPITAATAYLDEVIAWKKNAMYRGRFTGEFDQPWRWSLISNAYGCPSIFGHVETEAGLVFVTQRDVMLYDGSPPRSIADDVRKTLMAAIGTNLTSVFCAVDEPNNVVWFFFLTQGSNGYPDQAYCWNWKTGLWGGGDDFAQEPFSCAVRHARYTPFSSSPISGGTNTAQIANLVFSSVDAKLYNLCGGITGSASLTFWEQGDPSQDLRLNRTRAVFVLNNKPSAATLTITPYDAGLSAQTAVAASMQSDFSFGHNSSARYFGAQLSTSQSCELLSLEPEYPASHGRSTKP